MKKCLRPVALLLAVLCFASFLYLKVERIKPPLGAPEEWVECDIYRVGQPFSPWLTYTKNQLRDDGSLHSGVERDPRSGSWLVLAVAVASTCVYWKLGPTKVVPTDHSSA